MVKKIPKILNLAHLSKPFDRASHRISRELNECAVWEDVNFKENSIKPNFDDIFSENDDTLNEIIGKIENFWELKCANARIKRM